MHPYLFFNKNRTSVTHVGMHISTTSRSTCLKDNYKNEEIDVVASQEIIKFLEDVARVPRQHSKYDSQLLYSWKFLLNRRLLLKKKFIRLNFCALAKFYSNFVRKHIFADFSISENLLLVKSIFPAV